MMSQESNVIPMPVQWAEGMMLAPQHLQQDQIYYERLLRHQMANCQPFYWGVLQLVVDNAKLVTGVIVIERVHAVMPDGLVVQYQFDATDETAIPLMIDLSADEATQDLEEDILIQLAVPIRIDGAASKNSNVQRFSSIEQREVIDENTGDNGLSIYRLAPRLELKVGQEVSKRYCLLPLFKLKKDGMYKLDNRYCPPLIKVDSQPFLQIESLGQRMRRVLVDVRKKATELARFCQSENQASSVSAGQKYRDMIQQLTAGLPQIEVLLSSQHAHPFTLYQACAQLMADVTAIGPTLVPNELPAYQHNNCLPGFIRAIAAIRSVLKDIRLAYSLLSFKRLEAGRFAVTMPSRWPHDILLLELEAKDSVSEAQLKQWIEHAHIASANKQSELKKMRITGCKINQGAKLDSLGVVASSGNIVVEILYDAQLVEVGKALHIENQSPQCALFEPKGIALYVPNYASKDSDQ